MLPQIEVLTKLCDLKPSIDWKVWQDDQGNILKVTKKNKIETVSKQTTNTTSDFLFKAHPEQIFKYSYFGMFLFLEDGYSAFLFVGHDGRLRCSEFFENSWLRNHSPLLVGMTILTRVAELYMSEGTVKIENKLHFKPNKKKVVEAWVSELPDIQSAELLEKLECIKV